MDDSKKPSAATVLEGDSTSIKLDRRKLATRYFVIIIVAIIGFFCMTAPQRAPSALLIIGFVMLGLLFYCLSCLTMRLSRFEMTMSSGRRRGILTIVVCVPVALLALQSIGQLTVRDSITLGSLFGIGVFYIYRLKRQRH